MVTKQLKSPYAEDEYSGYFFQFPLL